LPGVERKTMATVEIHDHIEPLVAEWEQLARHVKASPFLWPGWVSVWWRVFGSGRLQVLAVHEKGYLAGLLPLHRFRGTLSSTTNVNTPLFGFLASNETVMKQLSHALFSGEPRRIDLSSMDSNDAGVLAARAAADAAGYRVVTESVEAAPYVFTDGDWEAYESGLRTKFRSGVRRRRRRLEEEGRLTLEVSNGTEKLEELLEEGFRVEGSGWKDAYGTSINAQPIARLFYTEIARWAAESGWLRLAFLRLDGQALVYCHERFGSYDGSSTISG
jgi:CelD/BcsL family acetyltransferase involved in cellulose biosynthesis